METFKLVRLYWLSEERDKHVWEDRYFSVWDETIGRMHLLKAHETIERHGHYADVLVYFEQALPLLKKDGVNREYYCRALADTAIVQCFLGQYDSARENIEQAFAIVEPYDHDAIIDNKSAILVLAGAFEDALNLLQAELERRPEDRDLRFTLATCLLHMECYDAAVSAYEQVMAKDHHLPDDTGLKAARRGQQPDWANL